MHGSDSSLPPDDETKSNDNNYCETNTESEVNERIATLDEDDPQDELVSNADRRVVDTTLHFLWEKIQLLWQSYGQTSMK